LLNNSPKFKIHSLLNLELSGATATASIEIRGADRCRLFTSMSSTRLSQIQRHLSPNDSLVLTSYSADGRVVILTINHETRANCLSTPVLKALLAALTSINSKITIYSSIDTEDPIAFADRVVLSHSPSIVPKVIIIKSVGKIFCSGHDLREFHNASDDAGKIHHVFVLCNELMMTIRRIPQIVISQVQISLEYQD
jgi:hypothetical protein